MSRVRFLFHPIHIVLFLVAGTSAWLLYDRYFHDVRYEDTARDCSIHIEASTLYTTSDMRAAIALIRDRDPERYEQLCAYVTNIAPTNECSGRATACAHKETYIGFVRSNYGTYGGAREPVHGLAGILAHEVCHFYQGRRDKDLLYRERPSPGEREAECDRAGKEFVATLYQ